MKLKCSYENYGDHYSCTVESSSITEPNTIKSIQGTHKDGKSKADVKSICFVNKNIFEYFPRGLHKIFPILMRLELCICGLKEISRADLVGLENLEILYLDGNSLTSLPDDLFQGMQKLTQISFESNKLKCLSSKLLMPLASKLEFVDFRENPKINSFYTMNGMLEGTTKSLKELMDIIDKKCEAPTLSYKKTAEIGNNQLWTSGLFSDFTVVVEEKKFPVHKIELVKHSSVFLTMLQNDNKETREGKMIIKDFNSEVVEQFLRYIYTGENTDATNAMDLFAIAAKYDVINLKAECEDLIIENIDISNAFEVLVLANLYGSEKMKKLAFAELEKTIPELDIPDKMMNQPERLKKIIEAMHEIEGIIAGN